MIHFKKLSLCLMLFSCNFMNASESPENLELVTNKETIEINTIEIQRATQVAISRIHTMVQETRTNPCCFSDLTGVPLKRLNTEEIKIKIKEADRCVKKMKEDIAEWERSFDQYDNGSRTLPATIKTNNSSCCLPFWNNK